MHRIRAPRTTLLPEDVPGGDGATPSGGGGSGTPAGGPEALRADLARERDRRQAAETAAAERAQQLSTLQAQVEALTGAERQRAQAADGEAAAAVRAEMESALTSARAQAATAIAHTVRADARRLAVSAGVRDDRAETFLRLLDLTGVVITDGVPDGAGIAAVVSAALDEAPEFRATSGAPRRAQPGSGQGASPVPSGDTQAEVSDILRRMQQAVSIKPTG